MAWQLHYTSARRGPTGRAGFQFVAETPGLPDGLRAGVTPFLSYRPPPGAPLSPDEGELRDFPLAFLYDRADGRTEGGAEGRPMLLQSRYLGRDYSGRYGNFFTHAVVADPDELEGLRPIELWRAPIWAAAPAESEELPELDDLPPGAAFDPEMLAEWLAGENAFGALAGLLDSTIGVLGRGHGRIVLVGDDVELIARWIAVVSYSLPVAAASRLTFVTYSADPEGAAQRLVGTTPDVWATAQRHGGDVFFVGRLAAKTAEAGRFARTAAECWRTMDFAGLDALGELALLDSGEPPALERAAGLLALCRGDASVTPEEEEAVAALLTRHGTAIPESIWHDLVRGVPAMGLDLALAVHGWARKAGAADVLPRLAPAISAALTAAPGLAGAARVAGRAHDAGAAIDPAEVSAIAAERTAAGADDLSAALDGGPAQVREAVLSGVLTGLAGSGEDAREAVLTDDACDLLYAAGPRHLHVMPTVAVRVLVSVGRRRRAERPVVTGHLLDLNAPGLDEAFDQIWAAPTVTECAELLASHPDAMTAHRVLGVLPSRAFTRLRPESLTAEETLRLADQVRTALPDGPAARDAAAVKAHAEALSIERPERAARALGSLAAAGASPRLTERAFENAAARLAERDPRFRTALLASATEAIRAEVGEQWRARLSDRARAGRSPLRQAETAQRNELVEVVLRLRRRGITEPGLEAWARRAATRWIASRQLESYFSGDREMRAELKRLIAEARSGPGD
ncbi:hypothetical protein J4573_41735 [Actinomadura barringtoniae]|uniref:Uncharacterized protein n=1 Tax=Actinomadura barringtoniae TaxID=1427535 RepID=A0A939T8Y2_9ACTN|nr:hypothetical protein [Actinomadura barringtoniae]MBO2453669.1 hypothetical protein [Actinomadura barringtoniae]